MDDERHDDYEGAMVEDATEVDAGRAALHRAHRAVAELVAENAAAPCGVTEEGRQAPEGLPRDEALCRSWGLDRHAMKALRLHAPEHADKLVRALRRRSLRVSRRPCRTPSERRG